jgi:hypothetical protein
MDVEFRRHTSNRAKAIPATACRGIPILEGTTHVGHTWTSVQREDFDALCRSLRHSPQKYFPGFRVFEKIGAHLRGDQSANACSAFIQTGSASHRRRLATDLRYLTGIAD